MKKVIILYCITMLLTACGSIYKLSCSQYLDGYWGEWQSIEYDKVEGQPDNFVIYGSNGHPSQFYVRVRINGYNSYVVKSLKKDQSVDYSGTIEYPQRDMRVSANAYSQQSRTWVEGLPYLERWYDSVIIKRNASIRIFRNFDGSLTYNIFFDGVGAGFCIPWR